MGRGCEGVEKYLKVCQWTSYDYKRMSFRNFSHSLSFLPPPLLPSIVAEDQPIRNRRSLLAVTETNQTTITLEFGNPPPLNVSTPEAPSVAQEINMAGETNDSVDLEVGKVCCSSTTLDHTKITLRQLKITLCQLKITLHLLKITLYQLKITLHQPIT